MEREREGERERELSATLILAPFTDIYDNVKHIEL